MCIIKQQLADLEGTCGLMDEEAGKKFGVGKSSIARWRKKANRGRKIVQVPLLQNRSICIKTSLQENRGRIAQIYHGYELATRGWIRKLQSKKPRDSRIKK
eukprot:TRINITY_DN16091_c1_g2_i1.p2 TRINITY_DN16091_c1_g2~~TRINITY_DN16091_c1_g2_i1.p2  ORF type:complete len:112 (-),score=3.70 TRINITY_DN16091_c1_g2_i1:25-327(-)